MKRIFVILGLCVITTTAAFAECVEVKGVVTQTLYKGKEKPIPFSTFTGYHGGKESGFEFTNLNNYTVTIEAEVRMRGGGEVSYITLDAKTFVIDAKKTYLWEAVILYNDIETFVVFKTFKCPQEN